MAEYALEVDHLLRAFGDLIAVNDVSFRISPGQIMSIVGPNGAGKTTTVRMCATLLAPTSGVVLVNGIDAVTNPRLARHQTGLVLGGDRGFYSRATARQNLLFFADVAGVSRKTRRTRVNDVLAAVALTDRADDAVQSFSRGMKQRLHIARSLVNQPRLLLLDEPTMGLDPEIAADIRGLVQELANAGTAILLTSHYMTEVEQLADRICVIVAGRFIAKGTLSEVRSKSGLNNGTLEESYLALLDKATSDA